MVEMSKDKVSQNHLCKTSTMVKLGRNFNESFYLERTLTDRTLCMRKAVTTCDSKQKVSPKSANAAVLELNELIH